MIYQTGSRLEGRVIIRLGDVFLSDVLDASEESGHATIIWPVVNPDGVREYRMVPLVGRVRIDYVHQAPGMAN